MSRMRTHVISRMGTDVMSRMITHVMSRMTLLESQWNRCDVTYDIAEVAEELMLMSRMRTHVMSRIALRSIFVHQRVWCR